MMITAAVAFVVLQTSMPDVVIGEQPKNPVQLKVGQKLVFSVAENRSTGASWAVKNPPRHGLTFLGISYAAESTKEPPVPGRPVTALLSFKATRVGSYWVHLTYGRSWEMKKGSEPWEKIDARVSVTRR